MAIPEFTRRPLSTRLRFEILKRDNFICQYCGRSAPDVPLHVDHVVPVAGGGTDDPLNLITSCSECNGGKSDVPLTHVRPAEDPAQHAADIARTEAAIREYNDEVLERAARLADDRRRVYDYLLSVTCWSCLRPHDLNWLMTTVKHIPVEVVLEKINAAACSRRPKRLWIPYIKTCLRRWREEGY